jgi:hypothetical protein
LSVKSADLAGPFSVVIPAKSGVQDPMLRISPVAQDPRFSRGRRIETDRPGRKLR